MRRVRPGAEPPVSRPVTPSTRRATAPCTSRTVPSTISSAVSVASASAPSSPARGRARGRGGHASVSVSYPGYVNDPCHTEVTRVVGSAAASGVDQASAFGRSRRTRRPRQPRRPRPRPGRRCVPSGWRFFSSTWLPDSSVTVAASTMRGQRLAAHDLGHHLRDVVVLEHVLDELLRVLARLLRAAHQVLLELALVDADLLLLGDLVEHELGGDRVADPLLQVGLELVDRLLLGVEVLPPSSCRPSRAAARSAPCGPSARTRRRSRAAGRRPGRAASRGRRRGRRRPARGACRATAGCGRRRSSSATVSNSDAVCAKSSSSSGSSCSLTEVTLTSTSTSSPSRSPPTSCEVKVVSSPADMPVSASSRPSSMPPLPTW